MSLPDSQPQIENNCVDGPGRASPSLTLVIDRVRTSAPDHFGLLSGYQWETLRAKLLRSGFEPNRVHIVSLSEYADGPPSSRSDAVVGFGEETLKTLTGKTGVDKWTLSPLRTHGGRPFVATYDFARLQKQFELNLYLEKALLRAREISSAESLWTIPEERFHLNPPLEETLGILADIKHRDELAVDVETGYGQINTVGFAWSPSDAIAINVLPDRFSDYSYYRLWRGIADVLEGPSRKILQNFIYDTSYFSAYGILTRGEIFDTMWAMKFLWPELKSNLGNVGRFYTKRPYWKDDGKVTDEESGKRDWGAIRDWTKHYQYNCLSKDMRVVTEKGLISIGEIARKKMKLRVRSWNEELSLMEYRPITNWLIKQESKPILWKRIILSGMGKGRKGLYVTPDHKILTERGWIEAREVISGDVLLTEGIAQNEGALLGTVWGDASLKVTSDASVAYLACSQITEELIDLKCKLFGGTVTKGHRTTNYGSNTFFNLYVSPTEQLAALRKLSIEEGIYKLNDMGIALWFMDDGGKQKNKYSPTMKLALQRYSEKERFVIWNYLKTRFGSGGGLDKAGNLRLSVGMSKRLCEALGYYFVPSLRYKMSHSGPKFSMSKCMKYAFRSAAPIRTKVKDVKDEAKKKRGYSTSYCLSVADNHNFLTEYGIVSNCRDTTGSFEASCAQREDLRDRGLDKVFQGYVQRLVEPIREMCANGLPVCLDTRERLKRDAEEILNRNIDSIRGLSGRDLNPRSPKQVTAWLKDSGVVLPKKYDKKSGEYKESTDSASIKKIRLKRDLPGLKELQEIKSLDKALSSYVNFDIRSDGRLSYSLNGCGTESLRWSGSKDPWDRGFNPQTIPREGTSDVSIKSMFVAPEGSSFVEVDLRQAESRFVAYDSADKDLIDMLESGADVHSHVGKAILKQMGKDSAGIPANEFKSTWRQLGKKAGHGLNYGMKAGVFVETVFNELDMVITKKDAEVISEAYFGLFPGIRRWHGWIRNELYTKRKLSAPSGWERYFYGRYDEALKEALSWRPQHTIPWITNHLMLHLMDERRHDRLKFRLLLQVHDALYLEVEDEWIERVARVCLDHRTWHPEVNLPGGQMWIPTEVGVGKTMSHKEEFHG